MPGANGSVRGDLQFEHFNVSHSRRQTSTALRFAPKTDVSTTIASAAARNTSLKDASGLPYTSKVRTKDDSGREVGVMHACRHRLHMLSWWGTAAIMAQDQRHLARDAWCSLPNRLKKS
jgi:hypothetical protein